MSSILNNSDDTLQHRPPTQPAFTMGQPSHTSLSSNTPPPPPPPSLPTQSQPLPIVPISKQDDFKDCKLALSDFKGVLQDTIRQGNHGKFKRDFQSLFNAIDASTVLDTETKELLNGRFTAEMNNAQSTIRTQNGMVAYSSSACENIMLGALQECKERTDAVFYKNKKHPLRHRPFQKQRHHPYAQPSSQNTQALVQNGGITVNTLPTLAPNMGSVNVADAVSFLPVNNIVSIGNEMIRCKNDYDQKMKSTTYSEEDKAQLKQEANTQLLHYTASLKGLIPQLF